MRISLILINRAIVAKFYTHYGGAISYYSSYLCNKIETVILKTNANVECAIKSDYEIVFIDSENICK